jgi:hypothetical protein
MAHDPPLSADFCFLDQTLTLQAGFLNANMTGAGVNLWVLTRRPMNDFLVLLLLVGFFLFLWGLLRLCTALMEN